MTQHSRLSLCFLQSSLQKRSMPSCLLDDNCHITYAAGRAIFFRKKQSDEIIMAVIRADSSCHHKSTNRSPPNPKCSLSPWWIVPFSCALQTNIPIAQRRSTGATFGFDLHRTTGWKQVLLKKPILLRPVANKNRLFWRHGFW
jgi:hypothetical protein